MLLDLPIVEQLLQLKQEHQQLLQQAAQSLAPPKSNLPIGSWVYRVVHDRVAVRAAPNVEAKTIDIRRRGDRVWVS